MSMRSVVGVVVGYLIFALPAALLFQLSGQNPHGVVSRQFMITSIVCGMVFAALGAWVAEKIAKNPWKPAVALAVVIGVGAVVSMATTPSTEPRWSQWSAIFLIAPSALIGGWLATRALRQRGNTE
jgi:uncharacterized membrane protein YfcA